MTLSSETRESGDDIPPRPYDWRRSSSNPNAQEVAEARQALLATLRAPELIQDRGEHLRRLVRGKKILDVGCVEHELDAEASDTWLHALLEDAALECLGVDVLEQEIRELHARGYAVVCHDLTEGPLDESFDIVVCGELLEHVTAPERLLRSVGAMLRPGGTAVLTTPNPWYINPVLKNLMGRAPFVDSADHVAWYDPGTMLELAARAGLRLSFFGGIAATPTRTLASRVFFGLAPIWRAFGLRREALAKTLVYHLER